MSGKPFCTVCCGEGHIAANCPWDSNRKPSRVATLVMSEEIEAAIDKIRMETGWSLAEVFQKSLSLLRIYMDAERNGEVLDVRNKRTGIATHRIRMIDG